MATTKCKGSGGSQFIDWAPDPKENYPGAVVCLGCSFGVLVVKGSQHQSVSQAGNPGLFGKVRRHYVVREWDDQRLRMEPVRMTYTKPRPAKAVSGNAGLGPKRETTYTTCSGEGCEQKIADHAWGRIKAEGWFIQKDGNVWCPDHTPEWVEEWRARKARS